MRPCAAGRSRCSLGWTRGPWTWTPVRPSRSGPRPGEPRRVWPLAPPERGPAGRLGARWPGPGRSAAGPRPRPAAGARALHPCCPTACGGARPWPSKEGRGPPPSALALGAAASAGRLLGRGRGAAVARPARRRPSWAWRSSGWWSSIRRPRGDAAGPEPWADGGRRPARRRRPGVRGRARPGGGRRRPPAGGPGPGAGPVLVRLPGPTVVVARARRPPAHRGRRRVDRPARAAGPAAWRPAGSRWWPGAGARPPASAGPPSGSPVPTAATPSSPPRRQPVSESGGTGSEPSDAGGVVRRLAGGGRRGRRSDEPAVVLHANRVVACSPAARAEGVRRGLRRREAQCPLPRRRPCWPPTPTATPGPSSRWPAAVEALTPRVEVIRPGVCAFPTRGPSRYFGGDEAAGRSGGRPGRRVRRRRAQPGRGGRRPLRRRRSPPGAAVGGRPPGASAGLPRARSRSAVLDGVARATGRAGRPVRAASGLRTLGDLAALPAADLVARFGRPGGAGPPPGPRARRAPAPTPARPRPTSPSPPSSTRRPSGSRPPPSWPARWPTSCTSGWPPGAWPAPGSGIEAETEHGEALRAAVAPRGGARPRRPWPTGCAGSSTAGSTGRLGERPDRRHRPAAPGARPGGGPTTGASSASGAGRRRRPTSGRPGPWPGSRACSAPTPCHRARAAGRAGAGRGRGPGPGPRRATSAERPLVRPDGPTAPWPGPPAGPVAGPGPRRPAAGRGARRRRPAGGGQRAGPGHGRAGARGRSAVGAPLAVAAWAGPWPCRRALVGPRRPPPPGPLPGRHRRGRAHLLALEGGPWWWRPPTTDPVGPFG